jgi:hypothetical protein
MGQIQNFGVDPVYRCEPIQPLGIPPPSGEYGTHLKLHIKGDNHVYSQRL